MASNFTTAFSASTLPPLPAYELRPQPPLLSFVSDVNLTVYVPILAYWLFSGFFHIIDTFDLFPQYRLHTPAEILKRNHVSRWECFRDVVVQNVMQIIVGSILGSMEPPVMVGKEDYDVARWAQWIRIAQRAIPVVLGTVGINAAKLAESTHSSHPIIAGLLAGGQYPSLLKTSIVGGREIMEPMFAGWELSLASAIYWYLIPFMQFAGAIIILDTWQYFWHRGMHLNKFLYNAFHSRHHRLYVPYAYGALYNHPVEAFLFDIVGPCVAYLSMGMSIRQSGAFFTISTFKTVDDHCGYVFPWDPLQHITGNNAGYHDIHHQSWGIKTNFSQPFFTFWDRYMGTMWTGGDVSARYERARKAAEQSLANEQYAKNGISGSEPTASPAEAADTAPTALSSIPPAAPAGKATAQATASRAQVLADPAGGPRVLAAEAAEELDEQASSAAAAAKNVPFSPRRSQRKGRSGSGGVKGLRERMLAEGLNAGGMRARMESS